MVILGGATSQGLGGGRGTEVPGACWAARPERGWGDSCSLQVREGLGDRDCGLACGGVPGSPTAPSPEGQALQESLLIEESCSSGACSSPAPHRQGDQGNILRLTELRRDAGAQRVSGPRGARSRRDLAGAPWQRGWRRPRARQTSPACRRYRRALTAIPASRRTAFAHRRVRARTHTHKPTHLKGNLDFRFLFIALDTKSGAVFHPRPLAVPRGSQAPC